MILGMASGSLELRASADRSRRLVGRFPYNKAAVLSDGGRTGRPRKEVFAPNAFAYRVNDPKEDVHLLVGHDFGMPLASRAAGTLTLRDSAEALSFEATISEQMQEVSWVRDFLLAFAAGLIIGISPGFRIPPERAVAKAEETVEEDPKLGDALIRWIFEALLFELNLVTRPAYQETSVEERALPVEPRPIPILGNTLHRWRP